MLREERQHRRDRFGSHRRRGGVVEIGGHMRHPGYDQGMAVRPRYRRTAAVTVSPVRDTHDMSERSEDQAQLRLLPGGERRPDWSLDERTRRVGRRGVAEAKAILR